MRSSGARWFCLYVADRTAEEWARSLSVRYVNRLLRALIYLPVNIRHDDSDAMARLYRLAVAAPAVVGVNHAQPHKSNPQLQTLLGSPCRVDFVVKHDGRFRGHDLNGPAFVRWVRTVLPSLHGSRVVIVGVGGAGEAIARALAEEGITELVLVDPSDRGPLAKSLRRLVDTRYVPSAGDVDDEDGSDRTTLVIQAAGDAADRDVKDLIAGWRARPGLFVDLRPRRGLSVVSLARARGWRAFDGHGMNLFNDHEMIAKLAEAIGESPPTMTQLRAAVERAI